MFTRIANFTGVHDIDESVRYLREAAAPLLRQQTGYRGAAASADKSHGLLGVLTMWSTEADRDASESALAKTREELRRAIGGSVDIEHYELVAAEMVSPPPVGAALRVQRVSMAPAAVEDNLAYFMSDVVPQMKAQPGFLAVRNMIDRASGHGMVGTAWTDQAALDAAAKEAAKRRQMATERGISFGEESHREIVFIDQP